MLFKTSFKWGVFLGLALVIGTQILTWLGLGVTNWFAVLTFLLVIVFVALGLGNIKRANEGKLTFVNAALAVLMIVLISRYVFQLYMFVYINFIDPNWVNQVAETWTDSMKAGNVPVERIDRTIAAFRRAWEPVPMFTVQIFVMAIPQLILGLITSLFFVLRPRRAKELANR